MTEASTRLDTIQRGNERALARLGGAVSAGILISNSLIKILNPRWEPGVVNERPLTASPDLEASVRAKGWAETGARRPDLPEDRATLAQTHEVEPCR